jgi:hypothetical protein
MDPSPPATMTYPVRTHLLLPALALFAALVAIHATAHRADAQVVGGLVVDAATGAPVAGARVGALDEEGQERLTVTSDGQGRFTIPLPAGRHVFRVQHIGYDVLDTEPVILGRGERVEVEIRLGPRPVDLEPLVVRERRRAGRGGTEFQRRMARMQATGQGRFITREEIEQTAVASVDALIAREPGVGLAQLQFQDVVVITARGRSSPCMPVVYIDGVQVMNDALTPVDLSLFRPDMIEGIEIYTRPQFAPPEFRTQGCGAIAVWTRLDGDGNPFTRRRLAIAGAWVALFALLRAF